MKQYTEALLRDCNTRNKKTLLKGPPGQKPEGLFLFVVRSLKISVNLTSTFALLFIAGGRQESQEGS